jgi:hypothetical protein
MAVYMVLQVPLFPSKEVTGFTYTTRKVINRIHFIVKQKPLFGGFFISGGDTGTVNPHLHRVGAMGPIHYVRFKRRIRLFSPTGVPNPFWVLVRAPYKN